MNKQEFFARLRKGLAGLPQTDIDECLAFYGEMLDDRMENGLSEEEAVAAAGSVDEIIAQTVADIPLAKIAIEKIKPKRRPTAWEIVFLVLGSPIWLSLCIAAFAVILSLYISLWTVIFSLWAVFVSFAVTAVCGIPACVFFTVGGNGASGLALLSAGIVGTGFSVFMLYGCKAATKGIMLLTKKAVILIKKCFIGREKAQ